MQVREQILKEAVKGTNTDPEWVAMQTILLYREYTAVGMNDEDALKMAKMDMEQIAVEALRIRDRKLDFAAWCVIFLGALACIGWYLLWV